MRMVLVADDNLINQRLMLTQLQRLGYHAEAVSNGQEAIDAAASGRYRAILMDWQMPVVDGLTATRTIRQQETNTHIIIIAVTAHTLVGDREHCLAAGMDDYLAKPVLLPQLRAMLERWMD